MSVREYVDTLGSAGRSSQFKGNDLFLAAALVSIVALMVLPVSTWLLDVLVAINIVLGLLLVLMGIYITSPLQFSVFPSVLLISTLYRLALSVATTRMILLEGDAGDIIDAFGGFVAGGNIVVGLVVFLIITIVQFIVIAKGAERVAEVGARFSLDAMPGKQMSIDSDLRSGLIDKDEARKKRRDLELEAKLHGSMDGAMKFVKGDAIAGIVIIIVNLLGGLAIGVLQLDMDVGEAMAKYSILTVGDGMVAQIPALLGALSAGLIVTRVTDSTSEGNLADTIKHQISSVPRASLIAGVLCFFFALIPGFPYITFIILGSLLTIAGVILTPGWKHSLQRSVNPMLSTVLPNALLDVSKNAQPNYLNEATESVPILLILGNSWSDRQVANQVSESVLALQNEFLHDLGVLIPEIIVHWRSDGSWQWEFMVYEVPMAAGRDARNANELTKELELSIRKNVRSFLGLQETSDLISKVSASSPDVVREALRLVPMQSLALILRNLIEEGVSIRNMRIILESIVEVGQSEKDTNNLTEHVRSALSRQTCHKIAPGGLINILVLSSELEQKLAASIRTSGGKVELSMDPAEGEKLIDKMIADISIAKPDAVVAAVQLRKCVRMLIEASCFEIPVLSNTEVSRHMKINVLGSIDMPEQERLGTG